MGHRRQVDEKKDARRTRKSKKAKVEFVGYVSCDLNEEHTVALRAQIVTGEFEWSDIEELVDNGYKCSVAWNAGQKGYIASLYDNDPASPMAGYVLTGWGSTSLNAFASLMYKHRVLLAAGWEVAEEEKTRREFG